MSGAAPDLLFRLPGMVAAEIDALMPELRQCEARPGAFSLEGLKASGIVAPAVYTSISEIRQKGAFTDDQVEYVASMAAYVVTRDRLGLDRDAGAAHICQAILPMIPGNGWGDPFVGPAQSARVRSLVTANVRSATAALWVVTWDQPFVLLAAPDYEVVPEVYLGTNTGSHTLIGEEC